jgi:hypothetical protein
VFAATASPVLNSGAAFAAEGVSVGVEPAGVRIEVPMELDCVNMTATAREYAVAHKLCAAGGGATPQDYRSGTCGYSYIWLYDANVPSYSGYAFTRYGYGSYLGPVATHWLTVTWFNWSTGGAPGTWTDVHANGLTYYDSNKTFYTHTGWVTIHMTGSVILDWGGTCVLLSPTDGFQIG